MEVNVDYSKNYAESVFDLPEFDLSKAKVVLTKSGDLMRVWVCVKNRHGLYKILTDGQKHAEAYFTYPFSQRAIDLAMVTVEGSRVEVRIPLHHECEVKREIPLGEVKNRVPLNKGGED